jgi:NAD(P)-dependent dehydrogenase (short-subunit alcohol dehydrogenase family)
VTGASSGIGLARAESYVRSGAHVVLNARDEEKLRRTAEALGRPEQIALVAGDIAARATAERMIEVARARFGRVDTLINNAGVFAAKPFADYSEVELDAYLDINLRGAFLASQAFVAQLRAQGGGGSIVSITSSISISALAAVPASATIAAKGGLNALTRSLALELAPEHIRVNAVAPGLVKTPLHGRTEAQYSELASLQPMGHVGETSDIVGAVRYLASARFVTGVVLPVDGGMSTGRW